MPEGGLPAETSNAADGSTFVQTVLNVVSCVGTALAGCESQAELMQFTQRSFLPKPESICMVMTVLALCDMQDPACKVCKLPCRER